MAPHRDWRGIGAWGWFDSGDGKTTAGDDIRALSRRACMGGGWHYAALGMPHWAIRPGPLRPGIAPWWRSRPQSRRWQSQPGQSRPGYSDWGTCDHDHLAGLAYSGGRGRSRRAEAVRS